MNFWFNLFKLVTNSKIPSRKKDPCQTCMTVADIDEEINLAVATFRPDMSTLQPLVALQRRLNRAHHPMQQLANELKSHIFEMVLPKQDEWGWIVEGPPSRIVTPLRLAAVCRNWREVAQSTPSLWSTIRIWLDIREPPSPDPSKEIPFVQDCILRSGALPLNLCIRLVGIVPDLVWSNFLDVISPSSNRWQSLSFFGPRRLYALLVESTFHYDHLRRLQRLQIIFSCHDETIIPVAKCFNTTTSLEKIYISGLRFAELQVPWNHLTSATVEKFGLEEVAQLFQQASRMTYCHVETLCPATEGFSMPPIIHQSLTALRLSGTLPYNLEAIFFGSLTLPHLQEFHTDWMFSLTTGCLPALVRRSSCPLRSISLDTDFTEFIGDSQPWPGITDLVLSGRLSTVYSIDPITQLLLEAEYFPDLRYLTFRRLESFLFLWKQGLIHKLLNSNGRWPDSPNKGKLHKVLVEVSAREFDEKIWDSAGVEEQLKAFNIRLRADGFELTP